MAFGQYPMYGAPYYQPPQMAQPVVPPTPTPPPTQTMVTWVQGEQAAKATPVAPGGSAFLMDSEANVFYIKTTDASGMPMPLRIFDYAERTAPKTEAAAEPTPMPDYATKADLEALKAEIMASMKKPAKKKEDNDE